MSVEAYTFPSTFTWVGDEGGTSIGAKQYYKDGVAYYNISGANIETINFHEHTKIDQYTRPLILDLASYNNGTSLKLYYFTENQSGEAQFGNAKIDCELHLVDEHGNDVQTTSYPNPAHTSCIVPYTTGYASLSKTGIYIPSSVYYNESTGGTTLVGKEAERIYPFGEMFIDLDGAVEDLLQDKEIRKADLLSPHAMGMTTSPIILSDNKLEEFIDDMINVGDGNNPIGDPANPSDKPFENNPSGPGGGKGGYTSKGDQTGKPGLPTSNVLSSGFIAMYSPTLAQLQQLGAKLWSDDFLDNFLKLWNDPMEAIISLGLVPFTPSSSGSTVCQIGNYNTTISMPRVTSQYMTLSCGSVFIDEFWGNALDYGPYTSAELFLPFVGMRDIDIDDVMDKTVEIDYNIDILGGESIAYVTVNNRVLYDYRCNLQTSVPISSSSYANLYSGILSAVKGIAIGAAAGGGMGAAAGALTSAVNVVTSKHSTIDRGGELSPNAGTLGLLTPYIILHRPVQSLPSNFGHFKGYPSNITKTLGSVSGYTEVEYIHLDGISATQDEKDEINDLLRSGVII